MQSNQTGFTSASSVPSSPYDESIFDRVFSDTATDMSRPTSPESNNGLSPFAAGPIEHSRLDSVPRFSLDVGMRTSSEGAVPLTQQLSRNIAKGKAKHDSTDPEYDSWQAGYHSIIFEENEEHDPDHTIDSGTKFESQYDPTQVMRPRLRRAGSHESLMSVSGMDIHTLQSRPSQLLAGRCIISSNSMTSQPVLSGTNVAATQTSRRQVSDSHSYLSGIAASHRKTSLNKKNSMGDLGSKVGWIFGRWGHSASPSSVETTTAGAETASISSYSSSKAESILAPSLLPPSKLRPPGINQPGPIFGLGPEPRLPNEVVVKVFDQDALKDSLENG